MIGDSCFLLDGQTDEKSVHKPMILLFIVADQLSSDILSMTSAFLSESDAHYYY